MLQKLKPLKSQGDFYRVSKFYLLKITNNLGNFSLFKISLLLHSLFFKIDWFSKWLILLSQKNASKT